MFDHATRILASSFGRDQDGRVQNDSHADLIPLRRSKRLAMLIDEGLHIGGEIRIDRCSGLHRKGGYDLRQPAPIRLSGPQHCDRLRVALDHDFSAGLHSIQYRRDVARQLGFGHVDLRHTFDHTPSAGRLPGLQDSPHLVPG